MAAEEKTDPKELERQKFLEEIRRRAEEAELRRIEEEERTATPYVGPDGIVEPTRRDSTRQKEQELPAPPVDEERLIDLRSRFTLAVDRKNIDEATGLYDELAELIPGSRELASFERVLRSLRRQTFRRAPEVEQKPVPDEEQQQKAREARKKKIAALLDKSISLYQQEKYEKARVAVDELLAVDKENEEAVELLGKIKKAKDLADLVKAEEERLKAEEALSRPQAEEPVQEAVQKGNVWGEGGAQSGDGQYELSVDEEKTGEVPKDPLVRRLVRRAGGIRIPVKPLLIALVVLTGVLLGYLIVDSIQPSEDTMSTSLLVLPGWHSPSDTVGGFLAYSLAEEVVTLLATVPDLRIIAGPSAAAMPYPRPAAAARALGVRYFLHWSIKTTPASVTFDLTLRDTSLVDPLWTSRRESSLRELPAAVNEIAREIAARVNPDADPAVLLAGIRPLTTNEDAYLHYLRGRFLLGHSSAGGAAAPEAFRRALEADPGLSSARVALAWVLLSGEGEEARGSVKQASAMLKESATVGSQSAEGLRSLALLEQLGGGYAKAQEYFEKALVLAPGDAESHRRMAMLLLIRGNPDEALRSARRATSLDPLNVSSHITQALVHEYRQEFTLALQELRKGVPLVADKDAYVVRYFPEVLVSVQDHDSAEVILNNEVARNRESAEAYYRLGRLYQAAGKPIARWEEALNRSRDLLLQRLTVVKDDPVTHSELALVFTRLGRHKDASSEIEKALKLSEANPDMLYNIARVYSIQKEDEQASSYLEKAISREYHMEAILDMDFFNLRQNGTLLAVVTR